MEDCVLVYNKIYFFAKDWNALYVINLKTPKVEYISSMPEENFLSKRLCAGIMYHKRKLILVPMRARKIWIYDLDKKQWIGLKRKYMTDEDSHKEIFRAIEYKNNLFFVGSNYPAIIRMNLDTYKLDYLTSLYNFLEKVKSEKEAYFRSDFVLNNNQLFIASCLNNYVLCLNLDTFDYRWHRVGHNGFRYSGIAWDGEHYWLSPRTGTPIVKWDGKCEMEIFPLPEGFDEEKYNFSGVQYFDGKLIFPGMLQNKTLIMDPHVSNSVKIQEGQYLFYRVSEKKELFLQNTDGLLRLERLQSDFRYSMYCEIQKKDWVNMIKGINVESSCKNINIEMFYENSAISLITYICLLNNKKISVNKKMQIGAKTWKNVLN